MNCTECAQHPSLRQTGCSQEINKRAEWKCPVCNQEYWYQEDESLAPYEPEGAPISKEPEKPTTWGKSYKFKNNP